MPHLKVADPGSNVDLRAVMTSAMATDGPVYYRVARYTIPEFLDDDYSFEWGKGVVVREGIDVTLFGTGIMTSFCIQAAELLEKDSIKAEVVHLASIKPIDRELILNSVGKTACAVTAENASIVGGFGDAVAEVLIEEQPAPLYKIGVRDKFIESGGIQELFTYHHMQPEDIASAAKTVIEKK